jgi:hypothetical protein
MCNTAWVYVSKACVYVFSDDMPVKNSGLKCCMEKSSDEPESAEHSFDTGRILLMYCVYKTITLSLVVEAPS